MDPLQQWSPTFLILGISSVGFPGSSAGKESSCNAEDPGLISGSGRSPGEGIGYPLQYSGLENSMDCIVHGVAKSQIRLSNFHFHMGKKSFVKGQLHQPSSPFSKIWLPQLPPTPGYSLTLMCMHMSILMYLSLFKIMYNTHIYIHIFPHPFPASDPILFSTA